MLAALKVLVLVWLFCVDAMTRSETEVNSANQKLSGLTKWKYGKRPFCNAFTGCGKKRVAYPLAKRDEIADQNDINDDMGEALSDLIDINAEPAVENVQKQIMSQAKIFEAIKEASKEIFRQKSKQKLRNLQRQKLREEEEARNT